MNYDNNVIFYLTKNIPFVSTTDPNVTLVKPLPKVTVSLSILLALEENRQKWMLKHPLKTATGNSVENKFIDIIQRSVPVWFCQLTLSEFIPIDH